MKNYQTLSENLVFKKENFNISAGWISYRDIENNIHGEFIARCRNTADAKPFVTFLRKNFTVKEYFRLTDGRGTEHTPLKVLQTKGYISPATKRALKAKGL